MAEFITTDYCDGLLTITINRPEKANALTQDMLLQLTDVFSATQNNGDLRVAVIKGAGEKVFCAGADLSELRDTPSEVWDEMTSALNSIKVLTIAAINGPCIGGGMSLALGCDIRVCVSQAYFFYPVLRNNVSPTENDCTRLNALIGPGRSSLFILGGMTVQAREALDWGLVDQIVEPEQLQTVVSEFSKTALDADFAHLVKLKQLCRGKQK